MTTERRELLTRFLGQYLRHRPASLGLTLQMGGWVDLRQFMDAAWRWGMSIGWSELRDLVESDSQHAFSLDRLANRIRANWGHTVALPPEPEPATPPAQLFTIVGKVDLAEVAAAGLRRPRGVSLDVTTSPAEPPRAARRFGFTTLLVDAAAMHAAGFLFRPTSEGRWLVEEVPPRFIRCADGAPLSDAVAGLPPGLPSRPPPPTLPGSPATYEEWKARKWSTVPGGQAILPTMADAPPGESTYSWQDAARYVLRQYGVTDLPEHLPFGVPRSHGNVILSQIEFVPALTAGRELGLARSLDPDRLLCVVLLRGNFTRTGGPSPGQTIHATAWHYVFDGRTGNLLQHGTRGNLPLEKG